MLGGMHSTAFISFSTTDGTLRMDTINGLTILMCSVLGKREGRRGLKHNRVFCLCLYNSLHL
jgi:hypothetical protein